MMVRTIQEAFAEIKANPTGAFVMSRAEQSRAEQSRAEQSRAEQSRAEQYRFHFMEGYYSIPKKRAI